MKILNVGGKEKGFEEIEYNIQRKKLKKVLCELR